MQGVHDNASSKKWLSEKNENRQLMAKVNLPFKPS